MVFISYFTLSLKQDVAKQRARCGQMRFNRQLNMVPSHYAEDHDGDGDDDEMEMEAKLSATSGHSTPLP